MNIKIVFSCISIDKGDFTKIVFETILPGNVVESQDDIENWIDNTISEHCNEFDLYNVLDWNLISFENTKDKFKETEIVKIIEGHLFFEDSIEYFYYQIGKLKYETKQIKKETRKLKKETADLSKKIEIKIQKKDYPSVWIEPSGDSHEVGFANHEEFASDWLKENKPEIFELRYGFVQENKYQNKYSHEILQDLGWIRILGWTDPPNFVLPNKITVKQRQSLKNYCLNNEVPYSSFPEILKS